MTRFVLCVGFSFFAVTVALAEDSVRKAPSKPDNRAAAQDSQAEERRQPTAPGLILNTIELRAVDAKSIPATGRKHWESILAQPAGLDFGKRESVTVKELLDQVREQHNCSLRLDMPTFMSLFFKATPPIAVPPQGAYYPNSASATDVLLRLMPTFAPPVRLVNNRQCAPVLVALAAEDANVLPPDPSTKPVAESKEETDKNNGTSDGKTGDESIATRIENLLNSEVPIRTVDLKRATVATALQHALGSVSLPTGTDLIEASFPMPVTDACRLDFLVEDDGFLITTRMAALAHKEIRIYSTKQFKELAAEELSNLIRETVRPWSWRSQIGEFGDQLRSSVRVPPKAMKSIVQTGLQLAGAEMGATVTVPEDAYPNSPESSKDSDAESLAAIGNATINGLVAFAQASLSGLQMFHYAEFPTGTIRAIPGKLIIRQSQAAHREIDELLKQLADE